MPSVSDRFIAIAGLVLALSCSASAVAVQPVEPLQAPLWAATPDVDAFEKGEIDRIADAQRSIDQLLAVPGVRTIANTLAPYDEAVRQLNAAGYFAAVMQAVHPDADFRDRATSMTSRVSAAQTALSLNQAVCIRTRPRAID